MKASSDTASSSPIDTDDQSLKVNLDRLRYDIREGKAGPTECVQFVKDEFEKVQGAPSTVSDLVKCLVEELSYRDAVDFLQQHLDALDDMFCAENDWYLVDTYFLIAENLLAVPDTAEAEKLYCSICRHVKALEDLDLEDGAKKVKKGKQRRIVHPYYYSTEALALAKLRHIALDTDAVYEKHDYFKQLKSLMRISPGHVSDWNDLEKRYLLDAFLTYGEVRKRQKNRMQAEKYFSKAVEIAAKMKDPLYQFCGLSHLYHNECINGLSSKNSQDYRRAALELLEKIGQKKKKLNVRILMESWSRLTFRPSDILNVPDWENAYKRRKDLNALAERALYASEWHYERREKRKYVKYMKLAQKTMKQIEELLENSREEDSLKYELSLTLLKLYLNAAQLSLYSKDYHGVEMYCLSVEADVSFANNPNLLGYVAFLYILWGRHIKKAREFGKLALKAFNRTLPAQEGDSFFIDLLQLMMTSTELLMGVE